MIICDFEPEKQFLCRRKQKTRKKMKKETVLCAMLATATCATAQNGKIQTSGVSADSVQTEKDSIKANQEAEIKADKEAEIQAITVTGHRPMYKMRNETLVTRVRNTPFCHRYFFIVIDYQFSSPDIYTLPKRDPRICPRRTSQGCRPRICKRTGCLSSLPIWTDCR